MITVRQNDREHDGILKGADAIVTLDEVNDKHGVGVLLQRIFVASSNLITVRSQDHYGGIQQFGDLALRVSHGSVSRDTVFGNVLDVMGENTVARVLCVPYNADVVWNALAIRDIYGVPLCTFLMDDQNIYTSGIPDRLMQELLDKSSLILAISPEMVDAYKKKYRHKIWFMPPLVADQHILTDPKPPAGLRCSSPSGVIVGNIWGQQWLDMLRRTVRNSGVTLRWHSNSHFHYIQGDRESLARDSILVENDHLLNEKELVDTLREAPFTVVPSGNLNEEDDRLAIARLSLPSRITFILATSHTPVIVMGSKETAAARFVEKLGLGIVCPYRADAFRDAVKRITQPELNDALRRNAMEHVQRFSDDGAAEWIWQSLAQGEPVDDRYEQTMDLLRILRPAPIPWNGSASTASSPKSPMLILSNAMPKSGSSLLYHYTGEVIASHFSSTGHQELLKLIDENKLDGVGGFVRTIDEETIDLLLKTCASHGPVVVKIHSPLTPFLQKLLKEGVIKATFGHRDPRDVILSAMDHRLRSLRQGKSMFSAFTSVADSIETIKTSWWRSIIRDWHNSGLVCVFRYVDLITHPKQELRRLYKYLGMAVDDRAIDKIIEREQRMRKPGRNQFNQGKLFRYQQEMTPREIELCNAQLGELIKGLGYSVHDPSSKAVA